MLAAAFVIAAPGGASAEKVKVAIAGGHDEIGAFTENHVTFVSLSDLADILGGNLDWILIGFQISYVDDTSRFEFILNSPFFKLNDSLYNMTYPAMYREGQLFVPALTFLPFLDRITTNQITWDKQAKTIRVASEYFNVTDINFSRKANGLLVEIFLTKALAYDVFVTEGNWINVSVRDGRVNNARITSRKDSRYMYRLKAHQVESTAQISVQVKRDIKNWHHKLVYDPPRIQVSIAEEDFEFDTTEPRPTIGPDDKIDVIVIDPGHGGHDYGAVGPKGTREKDIVLKIGKELAKKIRKDKHFKVIMTRDRDQYVSLDRRAKIANDAGADLFISIHVNASPKRRVRGWNVFFLAPAKNDSARAAAQFENSFFLRELSLPEDPEPTSDNVMFNDPIAGILNEMIMTEFQVESHDFAMMVDREFRRKLKSPARGVDQAAFFVLNRVFTPSVLVEAAFISNSTEEKLLKKGSYQKDVAESIYNAIKRFKSKYENE